MRATLECRLADLESRGRVSREPWVIVRRIVTPDRVDALPARAEFRGQVLLRHEGEAGDAFERRAIEAACDRAGGQRSAAAAAGCGPRSDAGAGVKQVGAGPTARRRQPRASLSWALMVAALRGSVQPLEPASAGPRRIVVSEGVDYPHRAQIETSWDKRMAAAAR